jgi:hypothetical protein
MDMNKLSWLREMGYEGRVPAGVTIEAPYPESPVKGYVPPTRAKPKNGKTCCYCGRFVRKVTREHVHPKHQGGTETLPCCRACNQFKGGMTLAEFRSTLETMLDNVVGLM